MLEVYSQILFSLPSKGGDSFLFKIGYLFLKRNNLDYLEKTRNVRRLLILMRDEKDFSKRLKVAARLGNLGNPVAFEPLLQLFEAARYDTEETRRTIAGALVRVDRERMVAFCLAEVQEEYFDGSRTPVCIWALGQAKADDAVPLLIDRLRRINAFDTSGHDLWTLIPTVLAMIGDAKALHPLLVAHFLSHTRQHYAGGGDA